LEPSIPQFFVFFSQGLKWTAKKERERKKGQGGERENGRGAEEGKEVGIGELVGIERAILEK